MADSVRHAIEKDERITGITSFIGCSSPRFQTTYAPQMAGRNFAQFIVNTTSQQATLDLLADYQPRLSESFPEAYVKFKRLDLLEVPELEFRFYGDNLDSLHVAAERMMAQMRQMPELEWVHTDFLQPFPLINVELDPVASAQLGINRTTAALSLASQTGNLRVGSIWEGDYELPIVVRDTTSLTISDVEDLPIASSLSMLSSLGGDASRTGPLLLWEGYGGASSARDGGRGRYSLAPSCPCRSQMEREPHHASLGRTLSDRYRRVPTGHLCSTRRSTPGEDAKGTTAARGRAR